MHTLTCTVINAQGLHARPAARIAEAANQFASQVTLTAKNKNINAKSIMQVMLLAAGNGTEITISCEGSDEQQAAESLARLISSQFD